MVDQSLMLVGQSSVVVHKSLMLISQSAMLVDQRSMLIGQSSMVVDQSLMLIGQIDQIVEEIEYNSVRSSACFVSPLINTAARMSELFGNLEVKHVHVPLLKFSLPFEEKMK